MQKNMQNTYQHVNKKNTSTTNFKVLNALTNFTGYQL